MTSPGWKCVEITSWVSFGEASVELGVTMNLEAMYVEQYMLWNANSEYSGGCTNEMVEANNVVTCGEIGVKQMGLHQDVKWLLTNWKYLFQTR
jgi:hypothetical protein